jgi:hypothetical protein
MPGAGTVNAQRRSSCSSCNSCNKQLQELQYAETLAVQRGMKVPEDCRTSGCSAFIDKFKALCPLTERPSKVACPIPTEKHLQYAQKLQQLMAYLSTCCNSVSCNSLWRT